MSTPASVNISESNTVSETVTNSITNLNFGSVDIPNMAYADHPLVIPVFGTVYAYQKWTRWNVTAWVDTSLITNFRWFKSAGILATGWGENRASGAAPPFATPTRTILIGGSWPTTSGAAHAVTGSFTNPAVGYSSYTTMGVFIDSTAVDQVAKGAHTITYAYDES